MKRKSIWQKWGCLTTLSMHVRMDVVYFPRN
jgi:hypothetical protein